MTGPAARLRRLGIDLGAAESLVGTFAGAVVAAALLVGLADTATGTVVWFGPDEAAIDIFDTYATDPDVLAGWSKAFQAGYGRADALAEGLTAAGWPSSRH